MAGGLAIAGVSLIGEGKDGFRRPSEDLLPRLVLRFNLPTGYAPDFLGREFLTDGLTVGYALALSQFLMTWVLGWMYARRANRVWDPLAARVCQSVEGTRAAEARPSTRFRRGELVTEHDGVLVTEHEEVPQR